MKKIQTLQQHRKAFPTDKAAAADLGADYMTYRRWLAEAIYSPEGSAWRQVLEGKGVELPHRGGEGK